MVPVMGGVVPKVGICAPNLSASSPMCLAVTQRRHLDGVSKTGPIACSTSVSWLSFTVGPQHCVQSQNNTGWVALLRLAKRGVHTLQFSSLTSSIQRIELCCTTGLSHRSLLGCTWHKCVERVQRHGKSRMVDPGHLALMTFQWGCRILQLQKSNVWSWQIPCIGKLAGFLVTALPREFWWP